MKQLLEYLSTRPADIGAYLRSLPAFLPPDLIAAHAEYERKFNAYGDQMAKNDGHQAEAEYERRRKLAAENPTSDNLAVLAQESRDELLKKYGERWAVFNELRDACIREYATRLSRMILPFVEKNAAAFRAQVDADFRALAAHYGVAYSTENNPAVQAVDRWLSFQRQTLTREDHAAANRYPAGWERLLPHPDYFRAVCAGNFAPAAEASIANSPAAPAPLKTAADAAAARAA